MLQSSTSIAVRKGRPTDAKALAGVFRESWQQAYIGIIPHLHLETLIRKRGPEWWRTAARGGADLIVLEADGAPVGYATMGSSRAQGVQQGEIFELYLLPAYQGFGLGELMFEACRHRLDQRKLKGLVVWALAANTTATDFYWRRGGRPVTSTVERFGKTRLEKIAFAWD